MTRVYYKEAVGAFVVFDVTRSSTFEAVSKWKHDLDSKVKLANGNPIPSVLLANKCDQKKDGSNNASLMDNFCKEAGFLGWFETSAKVTHYMHYLHLSGLAFLLRKHSGIACGLVQAFEWRDRKKMFTQWSRVHTFES